MTAVKLLLSQARRLSRLQHSSPPLPFLPFHRSLSSSSSSVPPQTDPEAAPDRPSHSQSQSQSQSVRVQPVSYAAKPKGPPPQLQQQEHEEHPPTQADRQSQEVRMRAQLDQVLNHVPIAQAPKPPSEGSAPNPEGPTPATGGPPQSYWTREDLRYVKNVPDIAPVSYPARVAPLPEDRVGVSGEDGGRKEVSEDFDLESRRIDAESRMRRLRTIVPEEEKAILPFPMLTEPEKKSETRPFLDLIDAIREVKANAKAKFDETIEAHVRLGIDQKRSELIVRGTMALPHGAKKEVRVAVFAEGTEADEARAAGADVVGGAELVEEIASTGKIDFDRCYTTHSFMKRLIKISKVLNQHGLMPNPKQGTVTKDVNKAVKEAKQGQIKFRMDKTSIVHVGVGKVSLSEEYLRDNIGAFMNALLQAKPAGLKKTSKYAGYVNSFHICSTMGPGFRVSIQSLSRAADHYSKVYLNA